MGYRQLQFPKDTTFLVTGGAGFIGSNLCEAILHMGYSVRCLDDLSTGKQANVDLFLSNPRYTFQKGDVKDLAVCQAACDGVDYVLHQAAWGSVPRSIELPLFYCANNIQGTLNMLEAARQAHVKTFVYASSSSVYGDEPVLLRFSIAKSRWSFPAAEERIGQPGFSVSFVHAVDKRSLRLSKPWTPAPCLTRPAISPKKRRNNLA